MSKKKSRLFQLIIVLFIFGIVYLSAILNAYAFRSSCVEAEGENAASMLSFITERVEYGLRFGRELDNYYGINSVIDDVKQYCGAEACFILDEEMNHLYGEELVGSHMKEIVDQIELMNVNEERLSLWEKHGQQFILLAINGNEGTAGYIGIHYSVSKARQISGKYESNIYVSALIAALIGTVIFLILFHVRKHEYQTKTMRRLVMEALLVACTFSVISTYVVLRSGYEALAADVAQSLIKQNGENIERLVESNVYYSDMGDIDEYFKRTTDGCEQVESIALTGSAEAEGITLQLPTDGEGVSYVLSAAVSKTYVARKVQRAVINVVIAMLSAVMISLEILIFLTDLLNGKMINRKKSYTNEKHETIERLGIVRGLSFFFASFRYMAVAFMSIVLAEIYRPVSIFGFQIPYEILMSIPLSSQVFISMITSYLSGHIINKKGWKLSTLGGVAIMICGTLFSAVANEPITFILAQMLIGTGLGFAKMGIDIYSVMVSSQTDMAVYTSSANAAIIVGYSCSASIGALIASIFGYSGAYVMMSVMGVAVMALVFLFGMDVVGQTQEEDERTEIQAEEKKGLDLRFPAYILLIIIPYYFIMMFVDYFFPVYANSRGVTTDVIGYVMLAYGIVTAYIGTPLCPKLEKKFSPTVLMPALLLILAGGFLIFALHNMLIAAVLIVVMIGIVDGTMPSIQFEYVYNLPFAKRIGFSRALGIEGFFSSLIGAIAPVIFGVVMLYGNGGLGVIALLVGISELVFLMMNGMIRKKKKAQEEKG